jgi:3-dehydroquinate dehydratase / shikimate dehydrogenase
MPSTEIVEVVTGRTMAEIRAGRDAASGDLVELRLDGVVDLDVAAALAGRRRPVIVTCRAAWEGGFFDGSESERLEFLGRAITLGAEYVDVEWRAERGGLPPARAGQLVLSNHDFAGTPGDLAERVRAMCTAAAGTAIVKVATTPAGLLDVIALRDVMRIDVPHVAIAMGWLGHVSRACPGLFGSRWTYAGTNAPGQLSVDALRDVYRVGHQSAATTVYGVAGHPLGHSASPAMHNAMLASLGLDAVYVPFDTADAGECLLAAEAFGLRGVSVTAPLKETLFGRVPDVDDAARVIGALNTLRRTPEGWEGRNFDVPGMLAPLDRRGYDVSGRRVVVIGAGGAGRMAAWAFASRGARVEIAARRVERARAVAAELGVDAAAWPPATGWDLLVNATPVGTWPRVDESPLEAGAVHGGMVYDLVYNPEDTRLLGFARAAGAGAIGGLEMLVGQACLQFAWWTGRDAVPDVMAAAARAFIESRRETV